MSGRAGKPGAWFFVDRRIEGTLTAINHKTKRPVYVGRVAAAAPATGLLKRHNQEQAGLVNAALTVALIKLEDTMAIEIKVPTLGEIGCLRRRLPSG